MHGKKKMQTPLLPKKVNIQTIINSNFEIYIKDSKLKLICNILISSMHHVIVTEYFSLVI
jgi:hypothetical protein